MRRRRFTFTDLEAECVVRTGTHRLDDARGERWLGAQIRVPEALHGTPPYDGTAYAFLQELRQEIFELGLIELPGLPVRRTNHTLAQRAPWEHAYSHNPYLTAHCQLPHQDTPPYPTAFWLDAPRRFFATWVLSAPAAAEVHRFGAAHPELALEEVHRRLVPRTLAAHSAVLVNHAPGLLLVDNSQSCALYHARTCRFEALAGRAEEDRDAPVYAFNEVGLLHHLRSLDERRGEADLDEEETARVEAFLREELSRRG